MLFSLFLIFVNYDEWVCKWKITSHTQTHTRFLAKRHAGSQLLIRDRTHTTPFVLESKVLTTGHPGKSLELLHLKWINKVLLYSTGNYSQSSGINHKGKEYKECVLVYNQSLCCTAKTSMTLCINYTSIKKKNLKKNWIKIRKFTIQSFFLKPKKTIIENNKVLKEKLSVLSFKNKEIKLNLKLNQWN